MDAKQNTLLIIDGHNFLYRGYYGVPVAAKLPSWEEINAVYGFFSLIRNTVSLLKPNQLIVIFDTETGIQNKVKQFSKYKANREYKETSIFDQLKIIKAILKFNHISQLESDNHEADDLIGSYASQQAQNTNSFIGSTDSDFIQILSPRINIVKSRHNNIEILNEISVFEKFGISPERYVHFHALKGDMSDNISGVHGIGIKTASKLIQKYNTIDNVYENIDSLAPRIRNL